jgi:hypothetical protein
MTNIQTRKVLPSCRRRPKNITRKKNNKSNHILAEYSAGFIRRMTAPLNFTVVTLSDEEHNKIMDKYGRILSDEEKMDIFMMENSVPFRPTRIVNSH